MFDKIVKYGSITVLYYIYVYMRITVYYSNRYLLAHNVFYLRSRYGIVAFGTALTHPLQLNPDKQTNKTKYMNFRTDQ